MIRKISLIFVILLPIILFADQSFINHEIKATVTPDEHYIKVVDKITIPADLVTDDLTFLLVKGMKLKSKTPGVKIKLIDEFADSADFVQNKYSLKFKNISGSEAIFTISYKGKIYYPIKESEQYARGFSNTPGLISEEGVFLAGSTYWVPWFNDDLVTFDLTAIVPEKWDVASQGERTVHEIKKNQRIVHWTAQNPMEEIYLIAAKFSLYDYDAGAVKVMAYLRTPDENLANKYLETTAQYLEMYRDLIGPYPFSKFALIENFWETGWGMASFTLLGQKVIRFPFILHSSYPHELLHNWWGNSAYVDFDSGNWCEGITVYMADHLIKEQRGQAVGYRRSTLQEFTNYVNPDNDFPLTKFKSRYNASSAAIGYGKSMMMFNMLRYELGDELFLKGFQKFYRDNKYKFASFDDIRIAFESVTDKDYKNFFQQWVERTGAPELTINQLKVRKTNDKYNLDFTLNQIQKEPAFSLKIPVFISFKNKILEKQVEMVKKSEKFKLVFDEEPLMVRVDPQFNVFRKLNDLEIPPALSKIFSSDEIAIILPSQASEKQKVNYKKLASIWSEDKKKKVEVVFDNEISEIPGDKSLWIFGKENKFSPLFKNCVEKFDANINDETIRLGKSTYEFGENSIIVTARHPKKSSSVIGLLTIENQEAVAGLVRKLIHYGKYSYLVFQGNEPTNIGKGQWQAVNSPMNAELYKKTPEKIALDLPKREPLARLAPVFSSDRMMKTVEYLASEELEGRGLGSAGIEKAADYITKKFQSAGLEPGADNGTFIQEWKDVIDKKGNKGSLKNIIGIIPGTNKAMENESVIVCAHYDHLGYGWPDVRKGNEGKIHYGADDNASGIAVITELAQILGKSLKPQRTIIFVAFSGEENGLKGSEYYVKNMKGFPAKKIIGVLNLDTVGRLGKNKLLILNASSAREWKFMFMGTGYVTGVNAEIVTQELDASDQMSFINAGIPAVQFFSGPNRDYHKPTDTFDKIDVGGMVKVASFVKECILYLAEREDALTFTGSNKKAVKSKSGKKGRRVSAGTMPDFTFSGEGVRIGGISEGSPANKAGLEKGDIIIKMGDIEIVDLRGYSNALKTFSPGDSVDLVYIRNGKKSFTKITLTEK